MRGGGGRPPRHVTVRSNEGETAAAAAAAAPHRAVVLVVVAFLRQRRLLLRSGPRGERSASGSAAGGGRPRRRRRRTAATRGRRRAFPTQPFLWLPPPRHRLGICPSSVEVPWGEARRAEGGCGLAPRMAPPRSARCDRCGRRRRWPRRWRNLGGDRGGVLLLVGDRLQLARRGGDEFLVHVVALLGGLQ